MKIKICILFFIQAMNFQAQKSQNNTNPIFNRKNEIRVDLGKILTNGRLELTYEYFFKKRFSTGLSAMYINETENNNNLYLGKQKYQIEPFIRYSLSNNAKSSFYTELFTSLNGGSVESIKRITESNYGFYGYVSNPYFDMALGTSIGYKTYIAQRFPINFNLGLGFNLFHDSSPAVLSRVGLSTGYRF